MRNGKLFLVVVIAVCISIPSAGAQVDLGRLAEDAFMAISVAEDAGGEVGDLLGRLNEAILLMESGSDVDMTLARGILDAVIVNAEAVRAAGVQQEISDAVVAVIKVVVLVGIAVGVWLRGDDYFWRFWRSTKRGFVLE